MSERIKELAKQAGVPSLWIVGTDQQGNQILEKFAELIVRECEQVSLKSSHRDDDMGAIIARQIKKHFGVLDPQKPNWDISEGV